LPGQVPLARLAVSPRKKKSGLASPKSKTVTEIGVCARQGGGRDGGAGSEGGRELRREEGMFKDR
jgi:hypothetical protein